MWKLVHDNVWEHYFLLYLRFRTLSSHLQVDSAMKEKEYQCCFWFYYWLTNLSLQVLPSGITWGDIQTFDSKAPRVLWGRTSVIDLFLSICEIRRGPEKSRGKEAGAWWYFSERKKALSTGICCLPWVTPLGVPLCLQCHLGANLARWCTVLKRKDSIFAQERHTVVMVEFPMSLNEQTPASSVILLWPLLSSLHYLWHLNRLKKKANYISTTILCQ